MNLYSVYINFVICLASFFLASLALVKVYNTEYDIQSGSKIYLPVDDKFLFRTVLRIEVLLKWLLDIVALTVCIFRLVPPVAPYAKAEITFLSLAFYVLLLLKSLIYYLKYSKSDFSFLNIKIKRK